LIHCTSGKDRTGVVVAALLKILEVPDQIIVEEYLLSQGEVRAEWIQQALTGIGDPQVYFNRIDIEIVKRNILGIPIDHAYNL
jgi:protein-tyrosine phosphatase